MEWSEMVKSVVFCHEWTDAWASLTVSRSMTKGIPCSPSKGMTNPERRDEWWNLEHFLGDWISFFREVWTKGIDPWTSLIPVSFLRISANLWWSGPWDAVMPHRRREDKLRFLRNLTDILAVSHNARAPQLEISIKTAQFSVGAPRLNFSHFEGVLGIEDIVVLAACDAIAENKLWLLTIPTRTYHSCCQSILNSPCRCSPFHLWIWASNWSLSIHQQVKRHAQCRCCISAGPRTFGSNWLTKVGSNSNPIHRLSLQTPHHTTHMLHLKPVKMSTWARVTMKSHDASSSGIAEGNSECRMFQLQQISKLAPSANIHYLSLLPG